MLVPCATEVLVTVDVRTVVEYMVFVAMDVFVVRVVPTSVVVPVTELVIVEREVWVATLVVEVVCLESVLFDASHSDLTKSGYEEGLVNPLHYGQTSVLHCLRGSDLRWEWCSSESTKKSHRMYLSQSW